MTQKRKTKVQSVALNEYLLEGANALVKAGKFSSISDVITTALTEFLTKYEAKQIEKSTSEIKGNELLLNSILQTEEGQKLFASFCKGELQKTQDNSQKVLE